MSTTRIPRIRVSVEPLVRLAGLSDVRFQQETGINVHRARKIGGVVLDDADRVSIRFGSHPAAVYGLLWWSIAADLDADRRERLDAHHRSRNRMNQWRKKVAEPGGTFCGRPLGWSAADRKVLEVPW